METATNEKQDMKKSRIWTYNMKHVTLSFFFHIALAVDREVNRVLVGRESDLMLSCFINSYHQFILNPLTPYPATLGLSTHACRAQVELHFLA